MRRTLLLGLLVLGLCGCGAGSSATSSAPVATAASSASSSPSSSTSASSATLGGCRKVAQPPPRNESLAAPVLKLNPRLTYTVTVQTNCGTFAFMLDVRHSPKTSASIYYLVVHHFFDDLTFHRIAAGFVIQGGDPTGSGSGGPGYTVVEPPPKTTQYVQGDVAMAKSQAQPSGASGSQFFVVIAQNATQSAGLTPDYALVGRVVSGLSVVQRIGALATNPPQDGAPMTPVVMSSVTVSAH